MVFLCVFSLYVVSLCGFPVCIFIVVSLCVFSLYVVSLYVVSLYVVFPCVWSLHIPQPFHTHQPLHTSFLYQLHMSTFHTSFYPAIHAFIRVIAKFHPRVGACDFRPQQVSHFNPPHPRHAETLPRPECRSVALSIPVVHSVGTRNFPYPPDASSRRLTLGVIVRTVAYLVGVLNDHWFLDFWEKGWGWGSEWDGDGDRSGMGMGIGVGWGKWKK